MMTFTEMSWDLKDGNLIAVLFTNEEDKIHVYDFVKGEWKSFKLYNPTYSNSVTGDVRYADQMDFDHSGEYLMYDAFNEISKRVLEGSTPIGILDFCMYLINLKILLEQVK